MMRSQRVAGLDGEAVLTHLITYVRCHAPPRSLYSFPSNILVKNGFNSARSYDRFMNGYKKDAFYERPHIIYDYYYEPRCGALAFDPENFTEETAHWTSSFNGHVPSAGQDGKGHGARYEPVIHTSNLFTIVGPAVYLHHRHTEFTPHTSELNLKQRTACESSY